MRWSFVLFFIVLFVVLGTMNRYAFRHAAQTFRLSPGIRRGLAGVLVGSLIVMTFGRLASRWAPSEAFAPLLATASAVQLAVIISVAFLLLGDLAKGLWRLAQRLRAWLRPGEAPRAAVEAPAEGALLSRRAVLGQAAYGSAFLIGGTSSAYGVLAGRHDYQIEEVPIPIPGLSRALDGFTIVQLSDIHVGTFIGEPELNAAFELVRTARPDLIVLTGDLIDHDARLAATLGAFARRLVPLAREGVSAITGNHDYYAGVDPTVAALRAAGAEVLRNEGRVIGGAGGFALLGVDDVQARRFEQGGGPNLDAALAALPRLDGPKKSLDLPRVLLCHNPSYFERAAGRISLQLSGHTHGGQVNLGVRPADLFLKNGWVAGRYDSRGSDLYINRGFGTAGPPARIGSPPEVSRIVLVAA